MIEITIIAIPLLLTVGALALAWWLTVKVERMRAELYRLELEIATMDELFRTMLGYSPREEAGPELEEMAEIAACWPVVIGRN